ncbi:U-box domain-containing protein 35 isoform X2 [Neltuma alba]|uniref:U-box domain-containing protein 35 isoform X2 n=2 Tax=Neltuma alba TaxID=207710 RepID=UPI0010A3DB73|nr:U-box domain-containing protein 35-like isoform X2 [Prosopis alba]
MFMVSGFNRAGFLFGVYDNFQFGVPRCKERVMMDGVRGERDEFKKSPSLHSSPSAVAVAIRGNKKSKHVVQWALDKFVPEGRIMFKLIHVHSAAFKKEMEWQTSVMLLPYKKMCEQRKVHVDVVVIQSDDIETAIAEEVARGSITDLVIGASSHAIFTSKLKGLSAKISSCAPRFCTVYAVSKGRLFSSRPSDIEIDGSLIDDSSETSCSTNSSLNSASTSQIDYGSVRSYAPTHSSSLAAQRYQALSTINLTRQSAKSGSIENNHSRSHSLDLGIEQTAIYSSSKNSDIDNALSRASSCKSNLSDGESWNYYQNPTMDAPLATVSPDKQENFYLELEKLRIELRNAQGMHVVAQSQNIYASQMLNNLSKKRTGESMKLKGIIAKENMAKKLIIKEREKCEAAEREAAYLKRSAEEEAIERIEAEKKAVEAAKRNENLEDALSGSTPHYKKIAWDEIVSATSSFSEELRIGKGACGTVYRCHLYHTSVAVKILHSNEDHIIKQLQQELEILSRIRHPNLLLLLGACPDHGCLVYEYMENGSLEDNLLGNRCNISIPWFKRYKIAWEIASVLAFLHSSKPKPIIHRDLKPANILLDENLVSKIGDIGLSTLLHSDTLSTTFKDTDPVGTLSYIDPEYQRTGSISPKSDVYAFGMVILQLLTAKPARALAHLVETAIDKGNLAEVLDPKAGSWPLQETLDLARLGLSCAELRRRDRPDLKDHVLPMLERLKEVADKAQHSATIITVKSRPPNHFICPILQDVMDNPCVAADGYTYDYKAIVTWLQRNDKSPMTNMPLPHKNLIPNYTLLSAIMEWKSKEN